MLLNETEQQRKYYGGEKQMKEDIFIIGSSTYGVDWHALVLCG